MSAVERCPPGWPGIPARWTSSAKNGIGAAPADDCRVWFTVSHGILNEIYYPRVDQACTRDMGLIVTDGREFFSEEKRHSVSETAFLAEGVPAYRLVNTCKHGRYRIEKEVLTDSGRPVLWQHTRFAALTGARADYRLYALLAPHIGNRGDGNSAWVDDYKGIPMLFAERDHIALALASSVPWLSRSVGFVGFSDGWQDLFAHKVLTAEYTRAENGNVALTGEIDLSAADDFVLVLAFGRTAAEAGNHARAALANGFEPARTEYLRRWRQWQKSLAALDAPHPEGKNLYRASTMVLRAHEAADFRGATIASLAIPWGFGKGDDDLGGYHLVWPRDMVETAGGLLAAGARAEPRRALTYLQSTQEADGHWAQNAWLDGTPYWSGVQMDETALPILLLDLARREQALTPTELDKFWPMARQAVSYLLRNGPVSPQDRWEEDTGYSPFTIAAEIAALLAAADLAELNQEPRTAAYLRETADAWHACIDRWMYAADPLWCRRFGVAGYYVRIAPADDDGEAHPQGIALIKNVPADGADKPAARLISPDALALVRFGLRAPDDPRVLDTLKVIDAMLKLDTPHGPCWHRYNGDGYGEHADGAPFDGTGIGRAWPLLTGERAHYELAAGRVAEAARLCRTYESFANDGGLLPEQIWDARDIPERELYFARPSGSAMPLAWAHAEYVKLRRSLRDGRVFDMPPQTVQRYLVEKIRSPHAIWRLNQKIRTLPAGNVLRVETLARAVVHWSIDDWGTTHDAATRDTGLGVHVADLPVNACTEGTRVTFTFYWPDADCWQGADYAVAVGARRFIEQPVAEAVTP
jgi:glucoamylase